MLETSSFYVFWPQQLTGTSSFYVFWPHQLAETSSFYVFWSLSAYKWTQKTKKYIKTEKVFFIEKTRAVDNLSIVFSSFFSVLGLAASRKYSAGGHFFIFIFNFWIAIYPRKLERGTLVFFKNTSFFWFRLRFLLEFSRSKATFHLIGNQSASKPFQISKKSKL